MRSPTRLPTDPRPVILLVEDDAAVRRSLQMLLLTSGYDVRAHSCAATLLADPIQATAACLIADFQLGDGDGIALIGTLRARGWRQPALLITGNGTPELVERALAMGFNDVIDKPMQSGVLAALVTRLIAVNGPTFDSSASAIETGSTER